MKMMKRKRQHSMKSLLAKKFGQNKITMNAKPKDYDQDDTQAKLANVD